MLFKYNGQQWFNTDCIETIDDCGDKLEVTLQSGRKCTVDFSRRELFLGVVGFLSNVAPPPYYQVIDQTGLPRWGNAGVQSGYQPHGY